MKYTSRFAGKPAGPAIVTLFDFLTRCQEEVDCRIDKGMPEVADASAGRAKEGRSKRSSRVSETF